MLTGLISRAGYWAGDAKKEYGTYENAGLIKLNQHMFQISGYIGKYTMDFFADAIAKIAALRGSSLLRVSSTVLGFGRTPGLWLTIRFWKDMLPRPSVNSFC